MADETKTEDALPKGRVVYCGTAPLANGNEAELWATEEFVKGCATGEALREHASAFKKTRSKYVVGDTYEREVLVQNGRLRQMAGASKWCGICKTDALSAISLIEKGKADAKAVEAAQAKARKEGPTNALLDHMARIVARAPIGQQEVLLQGLCAEIRQRANVIKRTRR